jgi:putative glutamine amidotransferase
VEGWNTDSVTSARPRPLIGVSTYRQVTSWWAWERDAALVPGAYLDMVAAAGGLPLLIPPPAEPVDAPGVADHPPPGADDLDRLVGALDGLVLIGGGDIDPARYGQVPDPHTGGINGSRDQLELGLVAAALARDVPVLAVCRGIQVLNVALGGDLVQHLPDVVGSTGHQPRAGSFGRTEVAAEPGSVVHGLLGARFEVLCCHHQALATLGRGLMVTATAGDGVVEAVELAGHRFVVGVQWHPEETGDSRLFEALIDEALGAADAVPATTETRSRHE